MQKNYQFEVSIIIINYNSGNMLLDCIESIKKHTSEVKYEIIVVDNNSKDGSLNFIQHLNIDSVKVFKGDEKFRFCKSK